MWIQDAVEKGKTNLRKVRTEENIADMFTKHVDRHLLDRHAEHLGMRCELGRHAMAPNIAEVDRDRKSGGRQQWKMQPVDVRASLCGRATHSSRRGVGHHRPDIPLAESFQLCAAGGETVRLERPKVPRGHFGSSNCDP